MISKMVKLNIALSAKQRDLEGKKAKKLREEGLLPGVIYGYKIKNVPISLNYKEFFCVYQETGESSLIDLSIEGQKSHFPVLIHGLQKDPVSGEIIHIDLYKPNLDKMVEALVPLVIKGSAPAVKNFGGTLVRHFYEVDVKALPMNLPHEIIVDVSSLEQVDSEILIKDLSVPEGVEVLHNPEEIVVMAAAPERVEEELEKPIEEKLEEIETAGAKKEAEAEEEEEKEKEESIDR
jgi:large subunit ribosomal protein L25